MTTPRLHIYLIFLLFLSFGGFPKAISQEKCQFPDTVTIKHKYYTTTFSKSKHFPIVVKYWLTNAILPEQGQADQQVQTRSPPT